MRYLPVVFTWQIVDVADADGVVERRLAMVPLKRYKNVCARQFSEGSEYPLTILEARSRASHNFYFASIHEGWQNLPEETAARYPTAEHMRKHLLVLEGFHTEKNYVCQTPGHARRLAVLIRELNEFAVIIIKGNVVRIFEAKSQSAAAMGKEEFEDSKKKVLDRLSTMIGVRRTELEKHARRSA